MVHSSIDSFSPDWKRFTRERTKSASRKPSFKVPGSSRTSTNGLPASRNQRSIGTGNPRFGRSMISSGMSPRLTCFSRTLPSLPRILTSSGRENASSTRWWSR